MIEFLVGAAVAFSLGWWLAFRDTRERESELQLAKRALDARGKEQERQVDQQRSELERRRVDLSAFEAAKQEEFKRLLEEARQLRNELEKGFLAGRKWLAEAFAEYVRTRDTEIECSLVLKPHPARRAAETVAQLREKRVQLAQALKLAEYQLAAYEEYFPFLVEYREAILDEVVDLRHDGFEALEEGDPALTRGYLSREEYDALPSAEKFQRALDRYWRRPKSNVGIGRLYERFVGYGYEQAGWKVRYQGILEGFSDFGRDLICKSESGVEVVQCKCWSRDKVIREKHILQLFGTAVLYRLETGTRSVTPVFVTTTSLSPEATAVARELQVTVRQEKLERYPMVKCNVNASTGEKIYHLPFDQQYDRIIVGDHEGEFYADTVAAAEDSGFRRAYRWRGGTESAI